MKEYRADIDGLRAISVLGVLAFHAKLPYVTAGFAGVDVFFVISGFLITGLLLSESQRTGHIDLTGFWARRIRRLAPALLFVLASVLLLSVLFLVRISGEVGAMDRAAIATLLLNSNHFFLIDSGDYFSELAEHNPLLHMWSLSVEEQYYLVWPVLLSLLGVAKKWRLTIVLVALLAASFLLSVYLSAVNPPMAFYLMPSRAWELLAGGLAAVWLNYKKIEISSWMRGSITFLGLFLILAAFCWTGKNATFSATALAIPVIGAVMLLVAGEAGGSNPVGRFLGSRLMAYIGKISYPLYLWHWPILVIMRSRRLYEESIALDLIGLGISILLAIFTYEFIERGVWRKFKGAGNFKVIRYGAFGTATVLACTLVIGLWIKFGIGYSEQERFLQASRTDLAGTGCMFLRYPTVADVDRCFPVSNDKSVLLWGDSHAEQWAPAISKATEAAALNFGVITMGACRPLPPSVRGGECMQMNEFVLSSLAPWRKERRLTGIVIAARWADGMGKTSLSLMDQSHFKLGEYYDRRASSQDDAIARFSGSLETLVDTTKKQGINVLIILPNPVQRYSAQHCLALKSEEECFVGLEATRNYSAEIENAIKAIAKENSNLHVLDPKSFMCDSIRCPVVLNNRIVYSDDDHVTRSFSLAIANEFSEEIKWLSGEKTLE